MEHKKDVFLTKADKIDLIDRMHDLEKRLTAKIYFANFAQLIAIVGAVLAIVKYVK